MPATNEMITEFQGQPRRTVAMGTLASALKSWKGSLGIHLGGVVRPLVAGATLAALLTTIPGADANGGVTLRALRPGVTVALSGGTSTSLGLTSITFGANTVAVVIQLAADNAAAITTTAAALVAFIRSHAFLNQILLCQATGTGAGLCAAASTTAITFGAVLGWAEGTYGDPAAQSNQTVPMLFQQGAARVSVGSPAPTAAAMGGPVGLGDDLGAVTLAPGPLDFTATLSNIDSRGAVYVAVGA